LSHILAPIDDAVAWIITQLFNLFSPMFGASSGVTWLLTIVVLVVIMRLILVPLFIKQMHTQRAMTALTPRLTELRKKHKGDRETLNAETMKLYQEAGVNPLMGCLPVILQMPIFFGLFSVLRYIAEWTKGQGTSYGLTTHLIHSAQSAKIFGATIADKVLFVKPPLVVPWHAKVVIIAAVVISMTTTYLTVRQSMKRGMMPTGSDSPMGQSQKLMAYIMPLFALTGLYWQFGLVLYWVTTNVWTLGQQFLLLRRYPVGAAAMGPNGNVPISGGKPATASGLVSRPAKPKPGTSQPGSSKTGNTTGTGKAAPSGKTGPGSKQVSTTKPAGKPAAQNSKDTSSKNTSGKNTSSGASSASGQQPAARAPADGSSNGHKPGGSDGGMLRRFGRKAEPEPVPEPEPQTKIVRQQRARQSRSKRSGKR
jgi:YidC/Oxa1 family membrane protein insertase